MVRSGAVVVTAVCASGREVVLGLIAPGQAFGQASLADGRHRGTARAFGHSLIETVDVGRLASRPGGTPPRDPAWARALASRCDALEEWLADLVLLDVPARLARRLCALMGAFGRHRAEGILIDLPVTQAQLAALAGATRESVNRALAGLAADGAIQRVGRRYLVTDEAALRCVAAETEDQLSRLSLAPSTR
ncbi:MAG: Crp/Fnr family transcriptional regulator [Actinomycetota bacterium]|nr:Crp/Fnr family transcriptional regulator [Actinomycetota bacterium]